MTGCAREGVHVMFTNLKLEKNKMPRIHLIWWESLDIYNRPPLVCNNKCIPTRQLKSRFSLFIWKHETMGAGEQRYKMPEIRMTEIRRRFSEQEMFVQESCFSFLCHQFVTYVCRNRLSSNWSSDPTVCVLYLTFQHCKTNHLKHWLNFPINSSVYIMWCYFWPA